MLEDNKDPILAKEKEKEKKEQKAEIAKDMHSLKTVDNNFVNASRPLPNHSQKIPLDWNDASYVK